MFKSSIVPITSSGSENPLEDDFDAESYCPYYSQHEDVICQLESEFGSDAEDITDGQTFQASDYLNARAVYAYALAYCAFTSHFSTLKQELSEAIEAFVSDVQTELAWDGDVRIQVSTTCVHGWASHDRELADGTMIWSSGQLDGCNGMELKIGELWVSCCMDPKSATTEEE